MITKEEMNGTWDVSLWLVLAVIQPEIGTISTIRAALLQASTIV